MSELRKCSDCKEELPLSEFTLNSLKFIRSQCRKCKAIYDKEYSKKRHIEYKQWIENKGCICCGYKHPDALEVHHLDTQYKRFKSSQDKMYNVQDVDAGYAIVLCANCHLIFHSHFGGRGIKFTEHTIEGTIDIINNSRRVKS